MLFGILSTNQETSVLCWVIYAILHFRNKKWNMDKEYHIYIGQTLQQQQQQQQQQLFSIDHLSQSELISWPWNDTHAA